MYTFWWGVYSKIVNRTRFTKNLHRQKHLYLTVLQAGNIAILYCLLSVRNECESMSGTAHCIPGTTHCMSGTAHHMSGAAHHMPGTAHHMSGTAHCMCIHSVYYMWPDSSSIFLEVAKPQEHNYTDRNVGEYPHDWKYTNMWLVVFMCMHMCNWTVKTNYIHIKVCVSQPMLLWQHDHPHGKLEDVCQ